MATVRLRHPGAGRTYYDGKKAVGKTSMEAIRALKRRLSNVVYARMLADQRERETASPAGQSGTTTDSCATGPTPATGPSDKPQPGPNIPLRRLCHRRLPPSTASNDSREPFRKLMHGMPRLCALQHGNGSDQYPNATKPQAVDLRLCHPVVLTLINPNHPTAEGPTLWIKPVGTRRPTAMA
ncbi:hypothetical protein [Nocardia sp. GAS34]|uniref:hypothetical protein n=1 Tax=unclassified Nocardia TaxID=2637762 RepID=UPI003D2416B6